MGLTSSSASSAGDDCNKWKAEDFPHHILFSHHLPEQVSQWGRQDIWGKEQKVNREGSKLGSEAAEGSESSENGVHRILSPFPAISPLSLMLAKSLAQVQGDSLQNRLQKPPDLPSSPQTQHTCFLCAASEGVGEDRIGHLSLQWIERTLAEHLDKTLQYELKVCILSCHEYFDQGLSNGKQHTLKQWLYFNLYVP